MLGFSFQVGTARTPPLVCSLTLWLGMGFTLDGTMLPRRPRVVHVSGLFVWPYYLSTYTASSYSSSSPKYSLSVRLPRSLLPLTFPFPLSPFPLPPFPFQSCRYDAHAPMLSVNYSTATLPTRSFVRSFGPSVRPAFRPLLLLLLARSLASVVASKPCTILSIFFPLSWVCRRSRSSIH